MSDFACRFDPFFLPSFPGSRPLLLFPLPLLLPVLAVLVPGAAAGAVAAAGGGGGAGLGLGAVTLARPPGGPVGDGRGGSYSIWTGILVRSEN